MAKIKSTPTKTTKNMFLEAFDKSESKSVLDICRIAGLARFTFYYHLRKDSEFKRAILEKQRERLSAKLAATV